MEIHIGMSGMSVPELAVAGPEALGRYRQASGADKLLLPQTHRFTEAYKKNPANVGTIALSFAPTGPEILSRYLDRRRHPENHGNMSPEEAAERAVGNVLQRLGMPSAARAMKKLPELTNDTNVLFGPEHIRQLAKNKTVPEGRRLLTISPDTILGLINAGLIANDDREAIAEGLEGLKARAVISPFDMQRASTPHISGEVGYTLPDQDEVIYELAHRGLVGALNVSLHRTDAPAIVGETLIENTTDVKKTLSEVAEYRRMIKERWRGPHIDTVFISGQLGRVSLKDVVGQTREILTKVA